MAAKAKVLKDLMNEIFSVRVDNPIKTKHASHAEFDEFSDDALNSGVGDMWYSTGHYTSTHPGAHKNYMDAARDHQDNVLGQKSDGENYAMDMDVDIHADPRRLLDIDAPVEDEMLDMIAQASERVVDPEEILGASDYASIGMKTNEIDEISKRIASGKLRGGDLIAQSRKLTKLKEDRGHLLDYVNIHRGADGVPEISKLELDEIANSENYGQYIQTLKDEDRLYTTRDFNKEEFLKDFKDDYISPQGGYREVTGKPGTPTNHELVTYLDDIRKGSVGELRGQELLKKIGLQGAYHDNSGARWDQLPDEFKNYTTFYPELMEIVKKEKGNVTLPMLATLAATGAAIPPAANKLVEAYKKETKGELANEVVGGVIKGAAKGTVGGFKDLLSFIAAPAEFPITATGRSGRYEGSPGAKKAANKLQDIEDWIDKKGKKQGWHSPGGDIIGSLIAPGI